LRLLWFVFDNSDELLGQREVPNVADSSLTDFKETLLSILGLTEVMDDMLPTGFANSKVDLEDLIAVGGL
jgi:hypothetical protein